MLSRTLGGVATAFLVCSGLTKCCAMPQLFGQSGATMPVGVDGEHIFRKLQAGACGGSMMEMGTVAANCCGSNNEYCQGPVPSQCDATCKPIWESFFSRSENCLEYT